MKYKIGDRVRIKNLDWYNENKDPKHGYVDCGNGIGFYKHMTEYCGKVMTISEIWDCCYDMEGHVSAWNDEMIEGLVEETKFGTASNPIEPKSNANSITQSEVDVIEKAKNYWDSTKDAWICPDGYQFVDENGNVINATKIVLEKKKREYPQTYEECCEILEDVADCSLSCFACGLLNNLQKLLLCRDAYWKIAGEKMGLGKPWKPDWSDYENIKYIVGGYDGGIGKDQNHHIHKILAFPTEEMRDAFYENFKKEIEICKELL